jgi:putative addiction module antidote
MAKISKVGNSTGVVIPRDALVAANLQLGDEVMIVPVQDGLFIAAASSAQGRMLAAAMADMDARPDLYRRLAE